MAGPWFAVLEEGRDWTRIDTIVLTDGTTEARVHVEVRAELAD